MSEKKITVTILDTQTGEKCVSDHKWSVYWWAEGNGSCDCNREILFLGPDSEIDCGTCLGCKRYLIVDADGVELSEFNSDYPLELRQKHGVP